MLAQTLIATLLAASASAASQSNTFRLEASVINYDLTPSVNGARLAVNIGQECLGDLVLEEGDGAIFYSSQGVVSIPEATGPGTSPAGILVTPGGTATVPSTHPVEVLCDNGTPDVTVENLQLSYQGGVWMACPADGQIGLVYRSSGQRTLLGCAEVQLIPICDSTGGNPEGSEPVSCN